MFGELADVAGKYHLAGAGDKRAGGERWRLGYDLKGDAERASPAKIGKRSGRDHRDRSAPAAVHRDEEAVQRRQRHHPQTGGGRVGNQNGGNSMTGRIQSEMRARGFRLGRETSRGMPLGEEFEVSRDCPCMQRGGDVLVAVPKPFPWR